MGKIKIIHTYQDPGHSWAKVKVSELLELGICHLITRCSYINTSSTQAGVITWAYLEEDCDLSTYLTALKDKGIEYKMKGHYTNNRSRIRGYVSFLGPAIKEEYDKGTETTEWVRILMAAKSAYNKGGK